MAGLQTFCRHYAMKESSIERIESLVRDALAICFRLNPDSRNIRLRVTYSESDRTAKVKLRAAPEQGTFIAGETQGAELERIKALCPSIRERMEDGWLKLTLTFCD